MGLVPPEPPEPRGKPDTPSSEVDGGRILRKVDTSVNVTSFHMLVGAGDAVCVETDGSLDWRIRVNWVVRGAVIDVRPV